MAGIGWMDRLMERAEAQWIKADKLLYGYD